MRRVIAGGCVVGALSLACGGTLNPEIDNPVLSGAIFEEAAYIPLPNCRAAAAEILGNFVTQAVVSDNRQTADRNPITYSSLIEEVLPVDTTDMPTTVEAAASTTLVDEFILPRTGLTIGLSADSLDWHFNATDFEAVLEATLSTTSDTNELRNLNYECLRDSLFNQGALVDSYYDARLIGTGEKCMIVGYIALRDAGYCTINGLWSSEHSYTLITPGNTPYALTTGLNKTFFHEFEHYLRTELGIRPNTASKREFTAYVFADSAASIMEETGIYPLTLVPKTSHNER